MQDVRPLAGSITRKLRDILHLPSPAAFVSSFSGYLNNPAHFSLAAGAAHGC